MTNNVRLTFSVGDTTWRVVYDKYWERQIELVALNTIFNVVVATKRLLNRSFIGFLQDWSNKYCGWLGCYIWSLTSQKKMGQVSNLLNFDLTFTLIDNSPSSMWRKFVRKHTAILRLLYKMKGSRHINVKLLKKERKKGQCWAIRHEFEPFGLILFKSIMVLPLDEEKSLY